MSASSKRAVTHDTFVIERHYDAAPERVFCAFSERESKTKWFHGPSEWGPPELEMDFRVGGRERNRGGPKGGAAHTFEARYLDIVENQRLIYSYDMYIGSRKISVSLATVEFLAEAGGTLLRVTEHGAFLDGYEDAGSRERGTRKLLEAIAETL
jgi:uncharacterized protein YndB with AHSA1/START domain